MGKILIVGGTKGIGQEIAQLLENRECDTGLKRFN